VAAIVFDSQMIDIGLVDEYLCLPLGFNYGFMGCLVLGTVPAGVHERNRSDGLIIGDIEMEHATVLD
jgi:hypothetical protein